MKRNFFLAVLFLLPLFLFGAYAANYLPFNRKVEEVEVADFDFPLVVIDAAEPPPSVPDIRTVTLKAVGDIMAHMPQVNQAALGEGRYDFSPSFKYVTAYLQQADVAVANLETTMAGAERGYSCYPRFNSPADLAFNIKEAGFDLVATANNHSLDTGYQGLVKTIEHLQNAGLQNFGTYASRQQRDTPLIVDVNGIKIAFLAYTQSTNGIPLPAGHEYCVNYLENFHTLEPIKDDISVARLLGADFVALYLHWGNEYEFEPRNWQRNMARELAAAGADLILGSHPHVIQPLEWIAPDGREGGKTLVAYSLGNFLSNQFHWVPYIPTPMVQYGLILSINVNKNMESGETWLSGASYEISWVHREDRHRIIPLSPLLQGGAGAPDETGIKESRWTAILEGYTWLRDNIVEKYGFSSLSGVDKDNEN